MTGTLKEEAIVLALRAMALLKPADAPKAEQLSGHDQRRTCKVHVDGRALLVRTSSKGGCAAAHAYATTAGRCVPDFRPKILGCDVERGILVEEWLDPAEYKSLAQELWHEPTSHGWSTPFRADEFSEIDFETPLFDLGRKIGKIHSATRMDAPTTRRKPRESYLRAASTHPRLANRLRGIAEESARVEPVLLHGCLSPGSVLFSEEDVAIISSTLSAPGDPAVDLAHMMAHLFVAAVHGGSTILVTSAGAFHSGYAGTVEERDKLSIMHRAGPLSAAFMLAVIEDEQISAILTPRNKEDILEFSQWWLGRRDYTLGLVRHALWDAVDGGIDWREKFESLPRAKD